MMPYMQVENGYIMYIGAGNTEITSEKEGAIQSAIENIPEAPAGYGLRLTTSLEWEMYESHEQDEPTTDDKAEAYDILIGGVT